MVMEGVPMVSYPSGSMESLLHKLAEHMKNGTNKIEGLPRHHVEELRKTLESLNGDLVNKVAERQETDGRVKAWMKQVRQLVVDIEDWIEPKLESQNENLQDEDFMTNDEIFKDFITQIQEACERCNRYKLLNKAPTDVPAVPVDVVPRRLLPEKKPVGLLGVDVPTEELVKKLTDGQKSRKVVSIFGTEGLGKTTLTNRISTELEGKFDCQVFVSVERRTSVSTILMDILRQLKLELNSVPQATPVVSKQIQAITNLREYLDTKRYLIIIDGMWKTQDWKVINCALPNNNCKSRVLITTCILNVAKSCSVPGDIHEMKALSRDNSKTLFDSRVQSKSIFDKQADDILKMCGGMPLGIIVAAGLLSRKTARLAEPKMVGKSDSTSKGMTKILYMSYADLSVPLKSCFMYLGVFPEGYTIKKDRLIRLWRAEGFIPETGNMWVTGETYFNELISRKLIQPIFGYEDDQAVGCTVHGVILDFIASLSREENFVTVDAELRSGQFLCYETVRRLSLHCCDEDTGGKLVSSNVHLSRVRSLVVLGNSSVPFALPGFKLIRVLDLEGAKVKLDSTIGSLFLLTYLGLAGTSGTSNDILIVEKLKHLQTLDIRRTSIQELPELMPGLVSVLGDDLYFLHQNTRGDAPCLEELSTVNVSRESSRDALAKLLRKSENLRILGIRTDESNTQGVIPFLYNLGKYNLESLEIDSQIHALDQWAPSPKLRRFRLTRSLRRVPPSWASLVDLTHLDISICQIEDEDLLVLGGLSNLILLRLHSLIWGGGCTVSEDGFQSLEVACFECPNGGMVLSWQGKAMPMLWKLRLAFNAGRTMKKNGNDGIKFPSSLTQVDVTISCKDSSPMDVEDVERAIRKQISQHSMKPSLSLELINHEEPAKMKWSDHTSPLEPSASS